MVAAGKQFIFSRLAAVPDRAGRMDDIAAGETISLCRLGFSRSAAAEGAALCEQFRAGCTVDRAVHTAAAQQGGVGRIDYRIRCTLCDVPLNDFQTLHRLPFFLCD